MHAEKALRELAARWMYNLYRKRRRAGIKTIGNAIRQLSRELEEVTHSLSGGIFVIRLHHYFRRYSGIDEAVVTPILCEDRDGVLRVAKDMCQYEICIKRIRRTFAFDMNYRNTHQWLMDCYYYAMTYLFGIHRDAVLHDLIY